MIDMVLSNRLMANVELTSLRFNNTDYANQKCTTKPETFDSTPLLAGLVQ